MKDIEALIRQAVEEGVAAALARHAAVPAPVDGAPSADAVLTKPELRNRWKCSDRYIEGKVKAGRLKATRLGGRVYFRMQEIHRVEKEGA